MYAKKNNLLDEPGWKRFRRITKREDQIERLVQQAKLRSFRTSPKFKFGYKIPRDYKNAMELDAAAGNNKWAEAHQLEMDQIREYEVFIDKGIYHVSKIPRGFKKNKGARLLQL